jgi:hypothetical protein
MRRGKEQTFQTSLIGGRGQLDVLSTSSPEEEPPVPNGQVGPRAGFRRGKVLSSSAIEPDTNQN